MVKNNETRDTKDFSTLDDLCFANGWSLQEILESDKQLPSTIIEYFKKTNPGLPQMCYAMAYIAKALVTKVTPWYMYFEDYEKYCDQYRTELTEIVNGVLERIQKDAEEFYGVISGGKK